MRTTRKFGIRGSVMMTGLTCVAALLASLVSFQANARLSDQWLANQGTLSLKKVVENISPSDARPGAVIAARTRHSPNYYFHWVRDAGIVMDGVVIEYAMARDPRDKQILRRKLIEYLNFSDYIQKVPAPTGLGEPKFNVDGSAYTGPWGRPQNDGPALRAASLIRWANVLIGEGEIEFVRKYLYDSRLPAVSVIKKDLEYVSHHWKEKSFDLWEEVRGDHFYTFMVQRRALVEGGNLAEALGDRAAAAWYKQQARLIEAELMKFWDESKGHFVATRNRIEGLDYKHSNLDTSVILGLLHGSLNDGFLPFSDRRVLMTIEKLTNAFYHTYNINRKPGTPGVAIGRYPEDRYGGANFEGGNPWPLCTLALAEAFYRAAGENIRRNNSAMASKMINHGDTFVERVRYHANADGSLSEQIDRETGFMTSVEDLTWNYAAILATLTERNKTIAMALKKRR